MKIENLLCLMLVVGVLPAPFSLSTSAATLLGVESDTGNLYEISTTDASLSFIGNTGIGELCSLELAPDGVLYGFNVGSEAVLFRIDPDTAQATPIGPLGLFAGEFEGGLAFAPDATAYGVNLDSVTNSQLISLNLLTGQATVIATISGGDHDINGLAWRSDGMLVGLDRVSNSLLAINPQTAVSSIITNLNAIVGGVGGMTAVDDTGYFSTAGPCLVGNPGIPGSNELYSFDLFSGTCSSIGSFPTNFIESCSTNVILGLGISGLALVPDPPLGPEPRLSIALLPSTEVQITWRKKYVGYGLEAAPNLPATWSPVTNSVSTCGEIFSVVIGVEDQQRFFRLHKL